MLGKCTSFLMAFLMLFGFFGGNPAVKSEIGIGEITFTETDITDGLEIAVPRSSGSLCFNRISFSYSCTVPVRAVFTYRQGVRRADEELLLTSKAEKASVLLNGYLARKTASRLISVRFEPIVRGQKAALSVSDFSCDLQSPPGDGSVYIENETYKAGVRLNWGGGLSWFENKNDPKYGNLLNCHDTGRLVQQSYYGPMKIEGYENGFYENTFWPYNPVQGGDQYGNTSKLVALEKSDRQIRVVCRPLDWAQNNKPAQTYYTNVYTLTENGLQVENTAVDFLQTQWQDSSQELPAFYTISALGSFVFYDGDKPWTDAPLRWEKELDFWSGKPAFRLHESNSETWCAWTDDSEYGVGLYTPTATELLAGRYMFNGTADADANPTNYVAPLRIFRLYFDDPFTYTYYLTAGSVQEIRRTFKDLH